MRTPSRLAAQLLRLARRGKPGSSRAAAPLLTNAEAFRWLVDGATQHRQKVLRTKRRTLAGALGRPAHEQTDDAPPMYQSYVGDAASLYEDELLPVADDADLASFIARAAGLAGAPFGYQVNDFQAVDWDLYRRFVGVVAPLVSELRFPSTRLTCFLGNYERTPFGAHVDWGHAHAFQYVVHGERRLRTWDVRRLVDEIGEDALVQVLFNPLRHAALLPPTDVLHAGPGDLLYWPGGHLHVIESNGPSFGVSVVFEKSPSPVKRAPRAADRALMLEALRQQTGRIFQRVPAARAVPELELDTKLTSRLVGEFPIRHRRLGAEVLFAVNGHAAVWQDTATAAAARRLLDFLNDVDQVDVRALHRDKHLLGKLSEDDVRSLLTFVVAAGGFDLA